MFETTQQNIAGNDGMIWFQGVVEDNKDPRQLGRVRVRVFGDHSADFEDIKKEDLPWSIIMMPPGQASTNGIGESPNGLEQGSFVFGFYQDGLNKQVPIIMGAWNGIPEKEGDPSIGFHDPDSKYPMKSLLNEPDTNRLARGEKGMFGKESEITKHKRDNLEKEIKTAQPGVTWEEPKTSYNTEYPLNKVWEFHYDDEKWGHALEFDSTKDYERIHLWHSSGTFMEIMNDPENEDCGRKVEKIVGDSFEIDMKNKSLLVKGDYRVTVEGNKDEYIEGNYLMHVKGSCIWMVDGEYVTSPSQFEPVPAGECKGGIAVPIPLTRGIGPAFYLNVTGGGTGTTKVDVGKGTKGSDDVYPIFTQNPAFKLDLQGDYVNDTTGKTDVDISISETTKVPDLFEEVTTRTSDATNKIINKSKNLIHNESNLIEMHACERLEHIATTILESTCLLLSNIMDTQTIVTPCVECGSLPEPDEDGNYTVDENNDIS